MTILPSSDSSSPAWQGFVLGLLGGVAASTLVIGIAIGYSLAGGMPGINPGGVAVNAPAAPTPPDVPLAPSKPVAPVTDRDYVRGNPDAMVTVIEYSDFECPFCKRHAPTMAEVMEKYKDDVNIVYRHFPLSFHPNAQKLAEASECAGELGGQTAFWKYHDEIFNSTAPNAAQATTERFADVAKKIGVDGVKFQQCIDSGKFAQYITDQMQTGIDAGVQGTPGNFIVNNETEESTEISGAVPFSTFQSAIDQILGKKS